MPKYFCQVSATVEIDAENVSQAKQLASRIKIIGRCFGIKTPRYNRDSLSYEVKVDKFKISLPKKEID